MLDITDMLESYSCEHKVGKDLIFKKKRLKQGMGYKGNAQEKEVVLVNNPIVI
jgi:hypothetical protein